MTSVLLRLIQYLYYFVKEMNRKDMEKGTTRKQRAKFRTVIALLFSVLVLYTVISGYYIYNVRNQLEVLELSLAKEKERGYVDMTSFVPRMEHEKIVNTLTHRIGRAEFVTQVALDELSTICETSPAACTPSTKRTEEMLHDLLDRIELKEQKATAEHKVPSNKESPVTAANKK